MSEFVAVHCNIMCLFPTQTSVKMKLLVVQVIKALLGEEIDVSMKCECKLMFSSTTHNDYP